MKRLLPLLLLLPLAACDSTPQSAGRSVPAPLVETAPVTESPLSREVERTGTLRAARGVTLLNREAGDLVTLPHHEGDRVAEGALLFAIDDALLQAELKKAEAQRRQAALDLRRITRLQGQSLVSEDELARARTALEVAEADVQLLKTRIDQSRMHAPFAGVVSERLAEPGDVLNSHSPVLTLIDDSELHTEVQVSELLLPSLAVGDVVELRIDALGATPLKGHILRIYPLVDPTSRLGTVEVTLDQPPPGARPGQLCRVRLSGRPQIRLSVPFSALRRDAQGEFVFAYAEGKVSRQAVHSGLNFGERVELLEGPAAGTPVVVKGFFGLADGSAVRLAGNDKPVATTDE